ncbi:biotin/lipoyl-containing protein [Flexivirga oryzae]|uniref:Biotin carboxyl carrier protein n=1 Tax=Flexivirga oryzae TaxID=1794944 RepID=A0A839N571_9MICO|nr:biotin/lipoyl-containing protein [Flexivirga oryzae]MBB2890776.1 biotin carboxyl carrier protein [Flexivirga oryzae]
MVRSLRVVPQPLGVAHVPGGSDKEVAGGVTAPFGGVVTFHVTPGDQLPEGSVVATIEAMKLEAAVTTPCAGQVARLVIPDGALVEGGDLLLVIE